MTESKHVGLVLTLVGLVLTLKVRRSNHPGLHRHSIKHAKPQPKEALPIITFDHDVTVHLNGEDIRALYFPAGHTDCDSIIFFPKSNVVHMGDVFGTYGFPFIDIDADGNINGMINALETVIAQLPPDVKVISTSPKQFRLQGRIGT